MAEAAVAGLAGGSVDLAVAGPALVTLAAVPFRSLAWAVAFMFGTLLVVLAVAVIGGVWPALTAVVVGVLARATLLTHPSGNLPSVAHANVAHANVVSPVLFAVVGTALSVLVGKLAELAREQAALRRMATLVAHAAPAEELFAAVTEEVGWLVAANLVGVARYDPGDSLTSVRAWTKTGEQIPAGSRWPLARDLAISVSRTGRPAWSRSIAGASGPVAADSRQHGVRSAAVVPIIAGDRTWGVMFTGWGRMRAPTSATEARLASFTDLVAAAIANAENLVELTASRARVVTAADETRRRIERDLHDGAQQRLVSLTLALRAAQAAIPPGAGDLGDKLTDVADGLVSVQDDLREMARGIHPAILSEGGLAPALKTLARRSSVPVELDLREVTRLPEHIEVAAYYLISEALTNAAKHANASAVHVGAEAADQVLHLRVRDDGDGGADPNRGSGLVGLKDRVEALGGSIAIHSPVGVGTSLDAKLPLPD